MSGSYDLVIFDCDGTLVDSEILNNVSTAEILSEIGLAQYTPDYSMTHFIGRSQPEIWSLIARETGKALPDDINQRYIARVAKNRDLYLKSAPGAASVVGQVLKSHKVCVASNGELANVRTAIKGAGLAGFFPDDQVFVAAMVPSPKPAPDLFLYAAARNNASPQRTLVIEDSLVGASAGLAAGMDVYGYTGLNHMGNDQAEKLRALGVRHIGDTLEGILGLLS